MWKRVDKAEEKNERWCGTKRMLVGLMNKHLKEKEGMTLLTNRIFVTTLFAYCSRVSTLLLKLLHRALYTMSPPTLSSIGGGPVSGVSKIIIMS